MQEEREPVKALQLPVPPRQTGEFRRWFEQEIHQMRLLCIQKRWDELFERFEDIQVESVLVGIETVLFLVIDLCIIMDICDGRWLTSRLHNALAERVKYKIEPMKLGVPSMDLEPLR